MSERDHSAAQPATGQRVTPPAGLREQVTREQDESRAITLEVSEAIAVITLNRPWAMNSFTTASAAMFIAAVRNATENPKIRALLLTGAGEKAFCTGADLKERDGMTVEQWRTQHRVFEEKNWVVRQCPKPVIAAVNGYAIAGGLEIALCCDFIYAATTARFGLAEVRRGIMPGGGGTQLLPRRVPLGAALELLLTGEPIDAAEAYRVGLVNHICDPGELLARAVTVAGKVAANSPTAMLHVKAAVRAGAHRSLEDALRVELDQYGQLVDHPDRYEGISAFTQGREPRFLDLPADVTLGVGP